MNDNIPTIHANHIRKENKDLIEDLFEKAEKIGLVERVSKEEVKNAVNKLASKGIDLDENVTKNTEVYRANLIISELIYNSIQLGGITIPLLYKEGSIILIIKDYVKIDGKDVETLPHELMHAKYILNSLASNEIKNALKNYENSLNNLVQTFKEIINGKETYSIFTIITIILNFISFILHFRSIQEKAENFRNLSEIYAWLGTIKISENLNAKNIPSIDIVKDILECIEKSYDINKEFKKIEKVLLSSRTVKDLVHELENRVKQIYQNYRY
ncbi:MAG: hypothetical protein QW678_03190 [Candidatus Aenigmatarchaeota archaeon]